VLFMHAEHLLTLFRGATMWKFEKKAKEEMVPKSRFLFVSKNKKSCSLYGTGGIRRRKINSFHALGIYSIIEGGTKQREAQFKKKHTKGGGIISRGWCGMELHCKIHLRSNETKSREGCRA
jgi:hypothetical protein